jgi:putative tryptophan/tyrosine transport system substrate-binding protein
MDRRTFISTSTLGLLATSAAAAQPGGKVYRIGVLVHGGPAVGGLFQVFRQSLRDLGYVEGRNLLLEVRLVERQEVLPDAAADLIRFGVDVIAVGSTVPALAAKRVTSTIPIVLVASADPVHAGLVASLAHPGANITGNAALTPELSGKQLELLREAMPRLSRVAVLWNSANPANTPVMRETEIVTAKLGIRLDVVDLRASELIDDALAAIVKHRADALLVMTEPAFFRHQARLADFSIKHRLPTISLVHEFTNAGSLMSYGPSLPDLVRRAAAYIDKILKGKNPADLPIEQPTKFEL